MPERTPLGAPLITVRDVTFGYGRELILDGVDLEIRRGEFLAILGPNGGGKTTLLKVILGLVEPWSGEVVFHAPARRGRLGYVPQFSTFDKSFPVRISDMVLMGKLGHRSLLRPYSREDRRDVERMLERLGLSHLATTHVRETSGGQLQRALIARALISDPEVLFLDEPTASIDAESRETLSGLLEELARRIPVVVVTHDVGSISPLVNRIACINRRLVYHGPEISQETLESAYGTQVVLHSHSHA
jgi:zinc transport system ATP-binding protein